MTFETLRFKQRLDHKRMVGFLAITRPYLQCFYRDLPAWVCLKFNSLGCISATPGLSHPGLTLEHCAVFQARAFELTRAGSVERFLSLPRPGRCSSSDR